MSKRPVSSHPGFSLAGLILASVVPNVAAAEVIVLSAPTEAARPPVDGSATATDPIAQAGLVREARGVAWQFAKDAGLTTRAPSSRVQDDVFAQALAATINSQDDVSISRLFDFRVRDDAAASNAPGDEREGKSLIDLFFLSDVPEPGTWALMIAGFFAIAGMLRRRPAGRAGIGAQA